MSRKQTIRFAFTIRDGGRKYWTSGSWRLWVHKEDTYIASAGLSSTWKTSLHGDDSWRIAITSEHANSDNPVIDPIIGRSAWEFAPTEFKRGRRLAFVIAPMRATYLPPLAGIKTDEYHIGVNDSWDEVTVAYIWMTEPGVDLDEPRIVGEPLNLASGRRVWLSAGVEQLEQPMEPDVAGTMLEPLLPERHGVPAPGLIVRGYRVG